ncbi:MAG: multiheme c-type cytochrome [candidate division WOR-3 bacterium]
MKGIIIYLSFLSQIDSTGCFLCHSEIRLNYTKSIHYYENVYCSDCHGGNEKSLDIKKAHSGNFKGKFSKKEILNLCSKCHSSAEKMAPYGITFDQFELYMLSAHGKSLNKKNNIPVCSDCHNYHNVYKANDINSPVNKSKVSYLCGNCHKKEFEEYSKSIHFEYVRRGIKDSPTCPDCHGSHGAYPPGFRDIDKICGKCHENVRANFLKSPHYKVFVEIKIKECEVCHGNHNIVKADLTTWDKSCINCHEKDNSSLKLKEEIKTLLIETENSYKDATEWISKIEKIPLETKDLKERIKDANNSLAEEIGILHTLNIERIKETYLQYKGVYDDVKHEAINKYKLFQTRYIIIPVLWILIIVTVFLIFEFKRRVEKA